MRVTVKYAYALLCILSWSGIFAGQSSSPKLILSFFGSSTCEECLEIENALLKPLESQHPSDLKIHFKNIEDEKDFKILTAMEKGYKLTTSSPQELFFPDTALLGFDEIMKNGKSLIDLYLAHPEKWAYHHAYGDSTIDTGFYAPIIPGRK
jgi:hypothetical protein